MAGWFRKKGRESRQKKALKQAKLLSDGNAKLLNIVPPEGVPLNLELAGIGSRIGAQIVDLLTTIIAAILLVYLIAIITDGSMTVLTIAFSLIFFAIRVPYYTITELLWNGRTLAKRWIGIRVISRNGRTLTAHQVVVRNLMREVEFFTPLTYLIAGQQISWIVFWVAIAWTCILFIVPWRSKHNQRLGDMIANTAVISDEKPILVRDLTAGQAAEIAQERFVFASHHLDHYGRVELQVLEKVIRANRDTKHITEAQRRNTTEIVRRIATKISYPERIPTAEQNAFLEAFYRAQRSHLESRKLFGDAREDKFFADEET